MAKSSTFKRKETFYPTPQNKIRLDKAVKNFDGTKKDGVSKNKIFNKALDNFFSTFKSAAL